MKMGNRGLWVLILPSYAIRFQCFLPNSESEWTEYNTGCSCFVLMFTLDFFFRRAESCLRRFKSNMLVNLLGQWQVGDVHKWKEGRSIHPHKNAQNTGNDFHCLELENVTRLQFSESLESRKPEIFILEGNLLVVVVPHFHSGSWFHCQGGGFWWSVHPRGRLCILHLSTQQCYLT